MHVRITVATIFFMMSIMASAQVSRNTPVKDSVAVMNRLNYFIDAFTNLKSDQFSDCFADDATGFFPGFADTAERANSKSEMLAIFKRYFEKTKNEKSGPPYLIIEPRDVRIQITKTVAIVTFHVYSPGSIGRRTLVYRKDNEQWRIIHMHGSSAQKQ